MTTNKTRIGQSVLSAVAAMLVGGLFVGGAVAPWANAGTAVIRVA